MQHAAEGLLRRLEDEPLSVPDRATDHVAVCPRCRARLTEVAKDADRCRRLLSAPQLVPEVDKAWARLANDLGREKEHERRRVEVSAPRISRGPRGTQLRVGIVVGAAALVVAGTAAATTTLDTVFAPTHVAPLSLDRGDLHALASFMGLGDDHILGGFPTASGSVTNSFGTMRWSSSKPAQRMTTLAAASQAAGFGVSLPSRLPAGVGAPQGFTVQPRVEVTVSFDASDPRVGGSSVTLTAGPAVLVEYGSAGAHGIPTLGILAMPRPTALSSGATSDQIETYLLSQPGVPPALAEEVRLLGDLGTTLPVPVPPGTVARSVAIGIFPGVLVSDASNTASGVVWEDAYGSLHVVAGLLDPQDVLNVAEQLS